MWHLHAGARVEPEFVSVSEGQAAAADAFEIIKRFGISHVTEEQRAFMAGQMKHLPLPKEQVGRVRLDVGITKGRAPPRRTRPPTQPNSTHSSSYNPRQQLRALVNMMRVTGRFESDQQKLAPWGYGDEFDVAQVPPGLRAVLEKIQGSEVFCLGKPRDITINYRTDFFYRCVFVCDEAGTHRSTNPLNPNHHQHDPKNKQNKVWTPTSTR